MQLFYGVPHDLLSVGGYTAWRVGGTASIFAAAWGLTAAVRALRAEEDAGRQELVLAGVISRRDAYLAALAAIANTSQGFGLVGMRERVALINGSMSIATEPGRGTAVILELPAERGSSGHESHIAI